MGLAPRFSYKLPAMAIVGEITGVWGYGGHVRVRTYTDNPERFSENSRITVNGRELTIESSRQRKDSAIVRFRGVETKDDAMELKGSLLQVPLNHVPEVSADTYYHFQIIDMSVWADTGEFLGKVVDILSTGSNDVYVVAEDGNEILVPAISDVVVKVDLEQGWMTVSLPGGLR